MEYQIILPYISPLITVGPNGSDIMLNSEIKDWCAKQNVPLAFKWLWNYSPLVEGPGHMEIHFKSETDLMHFSLRWL